MDDKNTAASLLWIFEEFFADEENWTSFSLFFGNYIKLNKKALGALFATRIPSNIPTSIINR